MIYKKNPFVQYRQINGKNYIAKDYEAFELDEISNLIWSNFNGENTNEDITNIICKEYNAHFKDVIQDVNDFSDDLFKKELIIKID